MRTIVALTLLLTFKSAFAKNILIIGDSHTASTFGITLHSNLQMDENFKVATFGNCGSSPRGWIVNAEWARTTCGFFHGYIDGSAVRGKNMKTPYLPDLLQNMDRSVNTEPKNVMIPDTVIVALGANQVDRLATVDQFNSEKKSVVDLVKMISARNIKCIWVGPPDSSYTKKPPEKQQRLYDMLEASMAETNHYCKFIGSRESDYHVLKYPSACNSDGIHFDACTEGIIKAVKWANYVTSNLFEE